ncbi:hypothetical protein SAMN05216412_11022 [Nitrosospira multiformis]|uniref:Transcriptional regulator n=1 Tax=Nitrosospira multiformis TaxID=1231 RepID=A0A1I0FU57_9PROT|nr:hypothetical protein SAMN05216412_11022 [Nitrosospira multiformis]
MDTTTLTLPTPDEIRNVLKKHEITRETAAGLVHVSLRAFHNWMAPEGSPHHRAMPLSAWELLLIKLGEIEVDRYGQ